MTISSGSKKIEKIFIGIWIIYLVAYVCSGVSALAVEYPFVRTVYSIVANGTIIALCIFLFCVKRYSLLNLLFYAGFILLVFLIEVSAADRTLLVSIMFLLNVSNVDIHKLIWINIKLKTGLLAIMLFLCACGVTKDTIYIIGGIRKHSMGTTNPNTLGMYMIGILIEWLCLHYGAIKKYQYVVIISLCYIVNYITGARTSTYTFLVVFFLFILADCIPQIFNLKIVKAGLALLTPAMVALSFLLARLYMNGNMFAIALNRLVTGRLRYAAYALSRYQPELIGQQIETIRNSDSTLMLDNAYIYGALAYGLLFMGVLCFMYAVLFIRLLNHKQIGIALLGVFYVVSGLGEKYMYAVICNISLLYLLCRDEQIEPIKPEDRFVRSKKFRVQISGK